MQNVIVTGGSRGLGLAMARTLAAAGYRVIALARGSTDELTAASRAAADGGRGAIEFRACDLSDLGQIAPLVKALRADFGPLYGLVNNAGLGTSGILSTMRDQDIQRLIQLNTVSPILLSKYVVRSMMAQREGRIINIASIVAVHRLQRTLGLQRHQGPAARLHPLAGARGRTARHHGERRRTRLHRHRNDAGTGRGATRADRAAQCAQAHGGSHRRGAQRRVSAGGGGRNMTGTTLTVDAGNTA